MSIKRAILNLGAGVFRVSKPGIDVTTASDHQLLLKEDYFYGQVVETGYVALSATGPYTVNFVNDLGFIPMVIIWPAMFSYIVRPMCSYSRNGSGGSIFYSYSQPNNTQMIFNNPTASDLDGFYYQVCKTPKG